MKRCNKCNVENRDEARFCSNCGVQLESINVSVTEQLAKEGTVQKKSDKKKGVILTVVGITIVAVAGAYFLRPKTMGEQWTAVYENVMRDLADCSMSLETDTDTALSILESGSWDEYAAGEAVYALQEIDGGYMLVSIGNYDGERTLLIEEIGVDCNENWNDLVSPDILKIMESENWEDAKNTLGITSEMQEWMNENSVSESEYGYDEYVDGWFVESEQGHIKIHDFGVEFVNEETGEGFGIYISQSDGKIGRTLITFEPEN